MVNESPLPAAQDSQPLGVAHTKPTQHAGPAAVPSPRAHPRNFQAGVLRVKQSSSKGGREGRHADKESGHDTDLDAAGTWGLCGDRQGGRLRSEQEARVEDTEADSMP